MQRLIIAKYTLLEAHKRSLIVLFLLGIVVCVAIAAYAASLSMVDKQATLAAFYAATVRLAMVAVLNVYLILMETRNLEQENTFVWLGLPVSRMHYLLQKILAYSILATGLALLVSLPLWWAGTDMQIVLRWTLGFYLELLVTVSISILFACLFRQALISLSAFAAVYLFARSALEFYQHSSNIIDRGGSGIEIVLAWLVKLCTFLVPKFEQFASASWILHQRIFDTDLLSILPQALLFFGLLTLIALDRLCRRGF
ncbi:MAG: hypothetical protein JXA04_05640 [Gammaproteobacteria bacterium]|nr:hypothetical protein [Gammaproteobacteria bacterium]